MVNSVCYCSEALVEGPLRRMFVENAMGKSAGGLREQAPREGSRELEHEGIEAQS